MRSANNNNTLLLISGTDREESGGLEGLRKGVERLVVSCNLLPLELVTGHLCHIASKLYLLIYDINLYLFSVIFTYDCNQYSTSP